MPLPIEALKQSIDAPDSAILVYGQHVDCSDAGLIETLRAGVIQHFEVCFEQCWKFTQQRLRDNYSQEVATYPRTLRELFRLATRNKLIDDPEAWFGFGKARNMTSHISGDDQAQEVLEAAFGFLPEVRELARRLGGGDD